MASVERLQFGMDCKRSEINVADTRKEKEMHGCVSVKLASDNSLMKTRDTN